MSESQLADRIRQPTVHLTVIGQAHRCLPLVVEFGCVRFSVNGAMCRYFGMLQEIDP